MYTSKDYKNLLGLKGFSDLALNTHFTLYEGYVKNTNSILEKFDTEKIENGSIEMAELKRRFGWEYNGMKLHEVYFELHNIEKDFLPHFNAFYANVNLRTCSNCQSILPIPNESVNK